MEQVLVQFNDLLGQYGKHRAFIDKATEQAGKFKADVIQKVIADHQIKASLLEDEISVLATQLLGVMGELDDGIQEAERSKGDLGERIEELELRRVIGEISEEEYEAESSDGRGTVDAADGKINDLGGQRSVIEAALSKWSELSGAEVEIPVLVAPEEEAPEEEAAEEEAPEEEAPEEEAPEEEAPEEEAPEEEAAEEEAPEEEVAHFDDESASEESVEIESESDVDFGFEGDAGDVDVAAAEGAEPVEVEFDEEGGDIGVELTGDAADEEPAVDNGADPRRALLLYQEGTPEEQIYPFTGEVLTVGRGRDNDIQIKNDSKVSRFHCKLFRRGDNFYVEDNKSSNGTLINGELITERRLFGGEEIIIGETFFRFRIM